MRTSTFIALLRGINITGHNKIPMTELRALAADLGWAEPRTYIQSGNLIFRAAGEPADLAAGLEGAIQRQFGLTIPVIVRTAADWSDYVTGNPFPEASQAEPNVVILTLSKNLPLENALAGLRERAASGERVNQVGDAIWIHFAGGFAKSKLAPGLLDRLVGSSVTTRNWRTVLTLDTLAGATSQ